MVAPDRSRLIRILGGDALANLRRRLRRRYSTGQPPADGFTLSPLDRVESDALAGLLGRPAGARRSMRLSHADIDRALARAGLAENLQAALECLDGPIPDRAAARARERRRWDDAFAQATDARLVRILEQPATRGLVKRLAGSDPETAVHLIVQAAQVLARVPAEGVTLAQLAADTLRDAHGLDSGRPVATLVRRALADDERDARPRDLWAQNGVLVNELAKPVLTLNLGVDVRHPNSTLLAAAHKAGEPLHLSLRLLGRRAPAWRGGQRVFVCENPEVVSAAADALGPLCPPMIGLDGQLSAAPRVLLDQLAAAHAHFHYHGDFDWPGLRIANHLLTRYAVTPWRFGAQDYRPVDGPGLGDDFVPAAWDEALAPRMAAADIAVHEESQLDLLLGDLRRTAATH